MSKYLKKIPNKNLKYNFQKRVGRLPKVARIPWDE